MVLLRNAYACMQSHNIINHCACCGYYRDLVHINFCTTLYTVLTILASLRALQEFHMIVLHCTSQVPVVCAAKTLLQIERLNNYEPRHNIIIVCHLCLPMYL